MVQVQPCSFILQLAPPPAAAEAAAAAFALRSGERVLPGADTGAVRAPDGGGGLHVEHQQVRQLQLALRGACASPTYILRVKTHFSRQEHSTRGPKAGALLAASCGTPLRLVQREEGVRATSGSACGRFAAEKLRLRTDAVRWAPPAYPNPNPNPLCGRCMHPVAVHQGRAARPSGLGSASGASLLYAASL